MAMKQINKLREKVLKDEDKRRSKGSINKDGAKAYLTEAMGALTVTVLYYNLFYWLTDNKGLIDSIILIFIDLLLFVNWLYEDSDFSQLVKTEPQCSKPR